MARVDPYSPTLMENFSFAFVIAGFGVGLIVGLTGVGGGSLMTPLLIFGFGIKPAPEESQTPVP